MAITVKHKFVSAIPDSGDTDIVQPSNWNDDHELTGTIPVANGGTGASTLTGYVKGTGTTAMTASATIPNTDITGLGTASTKDAGSPLGVATLDAGGKVPVSELPAAVLGALSYQGTWNASTNTPTLTSSTGTKGYYYVVSVAGNTNLDGITDWLVGDWAVYNGTVWQKVDNTETVTSVNGQTGAVVLTTTNVAEGTNEYFTTARARASVSGGTGISYNSTTGVITNSSPSLGGDVVGPSSATDNALARFDTTTGKLIQNSTATLSDAGLLTTTNLTTTGDATINSLLVGHGGGNISNNTVLGSTALDSNTTGQQNVAIGTSALTSATTANNQVAVGYQVLRLSNSADNTGVGSTALQSNTSGSGNVAMGFQTLTNNTSGSSNTALGRHALITNSTGSNLTALGNHAGAYETGSNALYIDAIDRTNTAGDKAGALLYGTFNATPSNQTLKINGQLTLPYQTDFNAAIALTGSAGTSGQVLTSAGTGATPTWTTPTTGTVTSVSATAGTGISVSGSPITSSGTLTITNTAPDQTVVLTSGTGISTSGTYPNFTVTNTAPDQTVAISSGTGISVSGTYPNFTVTNTSPSTGGTVTSVGGTGTVNGITLSGTVTSSGNLTLGGTLSGVNLATQVTGTLPVANGGTGLTSLTANRVPYGNGTSALGNEAEFTYDPSLNTLTAPQISASNGIVVNSNTVSANYTIPSGSSGMSAGPMTVANGITVTVGSGSRWVVL
jgi:hypothetical protein